MLCTGNKYFHFISYVTFYFRYTSLLPEKCIKMTTETYWKFFLCM